MTAPTSNKLNLGCGKAIQEGYWNVDLRLLEGVDEAVNLFIFPWPWEDNTFDEILASHIVEHIPHLVRQWKTAPNEGYQAEPVWDEDGFFIFFREVWRVLKPDGVINIRVPFARSIGADQDPTHTRYINEATFSYLWQDDGNFDYQLGYKFEQTDVNYIVNPGWDKIDAMMFQMAMSQYWNVCFEMRTTLKKVM